MTHDDDLSLIAEGLSGGEISQRFHSVVCCTSSRRVAGTELSEGGYIQGAGDDTENWAHGLTAPIWWKHKDKLLETPEGDLPELIQNLVLMEGPAGDGPKEVRKVAPGIFVGALKAVPATIPGGTCLITVQPKLTDKSSWVKSPSYLEVGIGKNKNASRLLRDALPQICEFVSRFLEKSDAVEKKIVVLCETGKDLSIGIALAIYCWCFDSLGKVRTEEVKEGFNKTAIRVKLGHIMTAVPDANPNRATLQSVNSFLMDWRK